MRARVRLSAFFLLLAITRNAHAAPPPAPTSPPDAAADAEAKRHFDLGLALYSEKKLDEALDEFLRSYQLGGHPSALKNAAQCLRDQKKYAAAYETYDALVTRHAAQLKDADRDAADAALAELRQQTGSLQITTNDPDAVLTLDDAPIKSANSSQRLDVGKHVVRSKKDGFSPFEEVIDVTPDHDFVVDVRLQPTNLEAPKNPTAAEPPPQLPPPPPIPLPPDDGSSRFAGGYVEASPFLAIELRQAAHISEAGSTTISDGTPLGGGAIASAGYAFSNGVAMEGTAAFLFDKHSDTRQFSALPQENYSYSDIGGFIGGGARIASYGTLVRATFAAHAGLSIRSFSISRDMGSTPFSGSAGYVAPSLLFDGGVLIGKTPGIKLFVGLFVWLDFAPDALTVGPDTTASGLSQDAYTASGKGYVVNAPGAEIYVGPTVGVRFGE